MKLFFYPAIALMNRLGYPKKFALLGLLFLVSITILTYSLFVSLDSIIRTSQQQLESITLIKPISRTVRDIQLHRGLSAALLNGNESVRDWRAAEGKRAVETFNALEQKLPESLKASEGWRSIRADWQSLQKDGFNWTAAENFAAHTHLIEQLLHFEMVQTRDTEIDMFHLIDITAHRLPDVTEHIGRIRAYGTSILSRRQITEAQKIAIYGMIANIRNALVPLEVSFDKAAYYNPALRGALSAASTSISDSVEQVIALVELDILTGNFTTSPEDFLMITTGVIDDYYLQLYDSLLPSVETLTHARIVQAENALHVSIGIAFLLFLIVVYFSIGSYYATVSGIQTLARSARAFAAGDMNARIDLGTQDELRLVGDSFNEMADGFSALLAEQKQAEQLLRKSADEIEDLYNHAPCGYHSLDKNNVIVKINDTELAWLGYARDEVVGKMKWHDLLVPEDAASCGATFMKLMQYGAARDQEVRIKRKDGTVFTGLLNATAVYDSDGNYKMSRSTIFDITERKLAEAKMIELAYYDTLTGLPNRTLFYDRLAQEIKKAHRAGLKMAVLYIDLDKFKEVNDTLGHSMGDLLLKETAHRINGCVREADTVARLGGDEFIIILSELDDAGSIERVAENILHKLAEPFQLEDEMAYVSASMGITLYPDDATAVEELLKDADQAMYVAKNAGRNRLSYFTPALEQAAQSRLHLLNDLRGALTASQFRVYYQPIVNLATGHIDKAEALLRWQHPERGLVSPAQFIPLAEETGLIVEIGDWVFREAAQQVKRWRALYGPMFQISVNKSPTQFRQSGTSHETWLDYLRELGLPGQSIAIEITEGLLLDADSSVTDKLLEFRDAGMQVSIDDFGTGYSSLSYLKKFDIDYLKIDQSFVRDLVTDPNDMTLSEAIIVMAHKLGLKVIAEGVETEAQRALLSAAGCDYAQGYLFSRPMPAEEFETFLQSNWLIKAEGLA